MMYVCDLLTVLFLSNKKSESQEKTVCHEIIMHKRGHDGQSELKHFRLNHVMSLKFYYEDTSVKKQEKQCDKGKFFYRQPLIFLKNL